LDQLLPPPPPPPPPAPTMAYEESSVIMVTGARTAKAAGAPAMVAQEEDLGDLKLYRVPEPVTVSAKGLKQVAFLDREAVRGKMLYKSACTPWDAGEGAYTRAAILLTTVNDKAHGLGVALPTGAITVFEPSASGELFVG